VTPKRLAALVFEALLVTAGAAAAAPGNAPADAGPDGADDGDSDDADGTEDSEASDDAESSAADENARNAERGPSESLPSQASDRASSVLDTVRTFLDGDLGPALAR
jgi:hypothetical protein